MIRSTIRNGSKVRVLAASHYGQVGAVVDVSVKLLDAEVSFINVTVRLFEAGRYNDVSFFIEQVESVGVADVRAARELRAAA